MVKKRSQKKSPQFKVFMKTDPNIPYTLEVTINSATTIFDIKSPGSDPKTAHDYIRSHAWFPQPLVRQPSKKKKSRRSGQPSASASASVSASATASTSVSASTSASASASASQHHPNPHPHPHPHPH